MLDVLSAYQIEFGVPALKQRRVGAQLGVVLSNIPGWQTTAIRPDAGCPFVWRPFV